MSSLSARLGEMHSASFMTDPKHLGFVLARYHFVARMFAGFDRVLEIGCGDCTGAPIVKAAVTNWLGIDKTVPSTPEGTVRHGDILKQPFWYPGVVRTGRIGWWNGIYALDVLEHIDADDEDLFFTNIKVTLEKHGTLIIGSPSLESQPFASELSRKQHINCKTEDELRASLSRYFHNVFLFGMNDCTLHTGFGSLCHYRLAICTGEKE